MARSILISVLLFIVSVTMGSGQANLPLPDFIVVPQSRLANVGDSITMRCGISITKLTENLKASIRWGRIYSNGRSVNIYRQEAGNERMYTVEEDNDEYFGEALVIHNVVRPDEGDYWCYIQNNYRAFTSPYARLTVQSNVTENSGPNELLPDFIVPPLQPSTKTEGNAIRLDCGIDLIKLGRNSIGDIDIEWYQYTVNLGFLVIFNGLTLNTNIFTTTVLRPGPIGGYKYYGKALLITTFRASDARDYFCEVIVDTIPYLPPSVKLNFLPAVNWSLSDFVLPPSLHGPVIAGAPITLRCGINLVYPLSNTFGVNTYVEWQKTDDKGHTVYEDTLAIGSDRMHIVEEDWSEYYGKALSIDKAETSDEGDYRCFMQYDRTGYTTPPVKLTVQSNVTENSGPNELLPDFIVPPLQPSTITEGNAIRLDCGIDLIKLGRHSIGGTYIEWYQYTVDQDFLVIENGPTANQNIFTTTVLRPGPISGYKYYGKALLITTFRASDARNYSCEVIVDDIPYLPPSVKLNFLPVNWLLSDFVLPPSLHGPVIAGAPITLRCGINLTYPLSNPVTVKTYVGWQKTDDKGHTVYEDTLAIGSDRMHIVEEHGSEYYGKALSIDKAETSDEGDYRCFMQYDLTGYTTPPVKLTVQSNVTENSATNSPLPDFTLQPTQPPPLIKGRRIELDGGTNVTRRGKSSTDGTAIAWWKCLFMETLAMRGNSLSVVTVVMELGSIVW